MSACAKDHSANRTDIAVVPTPRHRDMPARWKHVVWGITVNPADVRAKKRNPGVRRIRADQLLFSPRRNGLQITTHIPRRKPHGAEAANLQLGKILTNPAAQSKHVF